MSGRFQDKVAIITGASRGVGLVNAQMMAAEGAKVVMTDVSEETGQAGAAAIGENAMFIKHDVSNPDDWANVIQMVKETYGRLDILINNAAILEFGEITNTTLESWHKIQAVNSDSVFIGTQAALPLLEESGGGSIVNMSSSAAVFGMPFFVAYSASKSAVRGLTKAVAVHCHRSQNNVRCNSIHPDGIATDMPMEVAEDIPEMDPNNALKAMSFTCMPEDIAKTVLFLASDDSVGINGAAINVNKSATITPPYL